MVRRKINIHSCQSKTWTKIRSENIIFTTLKVLREKKETEFKTQI